jgi:hypothetical protein
MDAKLGQSYGVLTHSVAAKSLHQATTEVYTNDTKLKLFISKAEKFARTKRRCSSNTQIPTNKHPVVAEILLKEDFAICA